MNLYDKLEVPTNASKKDIEKAYRKKAMKQHPDHGGDREAFKELALAYNILKDPEKREHYDRTGNTDRPSSQKDTVLRALIIKAFATSDRPIQFICQQLDSQIKELDQKRSSLNSTKNVIELRLAKFLKKHTNELIQETLEAYILDIDDDIKSLTTGLDELNDLVKIFKEYGEPDEGNNYSSAKMDVNAFLEQIQASGWGRNWNP